MVGVKFVPILCEIGKYSFSFEIGAARVLENASMTGGYLLTAVPGLVNVCLMRADGLLARSENS